MSLTSRVFGLFTTTENSASNSDAPSSTSQSQAAAPAGDHAFQTAGSMSSRVQTAPAYNEEEEPRPPYLHVCLPPHMVSLAAVSFPYANHVCAGLGHACRWYGWNMWGYAHAFSRYGQDAAAGRSDVSAEIPFYDFVVCDDLSTGGADAWTVWWCDACVVGVVSWDGHLLWDV